MKASVGSSFVRSYRHLGFAQSVRRGLLLAAVFAAVSVPILGGGGSASSQVLDSGGALQATIRTTSHGVPHITASNYAGLAYGYGYAAAKENICVLADIYLTVNAERSRWFGPDGTYTQGGNGASQTNLNSDFFYQRIKDKGAIQHLLSLEPPRGPRPELKEAVRGYVAGYNRWLRETGVNNITDPRCQGKQWVRPINEMDAYQRFYQLGMLASQGVAIDGIGSAQPPPGAGPAPAAATSAEQRQMISELGEKLPLGGIGSNAYGLGRDATDNGRGMVLGNPHFPWDGSERFFESQITIPGTLNAAGGSLLGVPIILIGHTDNLAWSHTVSTAYRFTPFELKLVPGSPTTYLYDGEPREMTRDAVSVRVKTESGALTTRTRTLYSSHHGPVFTSLLGLNLFPWTPTTAWSMGDANAGNFRYLNHFFETNRAQSVQEYKEILERNQGIPWVNSIAADSNGDAFYADISVVPNVTNEKAAQCNTELGRGTYEALGLPVLDGSLSACEWGTDPDAVEPGIFGPGNLPKMFRSDYVTNSNDSYWLSNPEQPLEGFDRIIGDERTERSLRTRSGLVQVEERLAGTDGWPGNRYSLQQLQDTVFQNRQYAGELWRDELVSFCESTPVMVGSSGPVDVSEACPILRDWDLKDDLDSRGALLFRRFASLALGAVPVTGTPGLYTTQFDANDGVHTPSGLNVSNPAVERSFADAVRDMRNAGIPLDAPLRDWQYEKRGNERIPIHGGPGGVGVFNAINVSWSGSGSERGYPNVPHGSSFVMAAQFTGGDCPVDARTILTYSQSTNPNSPYFADQTRMFSRKEWKDDLYCEDEIAADPNLQVTTISEDPYPRPSSAPRIEAALVPAFDECTGATVNRVHGPPLAGPSCAPARQTSETATPGSQFHGQVKMAVRAGDPNVAEDSDFSIDAILYDVRCGPGGAAARCGAFNDRGAPDYQGELEAAVGLRITDRYNGGGGGGNGDAATVADMPFPATIPCGGTPGDVGATCSLRTTANVLVPGFVKEGKRAVVQAGQVRVSDSGTDGVVATQPNRLFAVQGVFVP